jgi:hypothetical protein
VPVGAVTVVVDAYDLAGNHTHVEWPFTIVAPSPPGGPGDHGGPGGPGPVALFASHDAAGKVLSTGDVLTVSLTGPPGGQATFSLGQWKQDLPMTELAGQPGSYQGTFTVPDLTADRQETVTTRLRPDHGPALTATVTLPVNFARRSDLLPVLMRPAEDDHVGKTVVIEGTTRPLAQVECLITWKGTVLGLLQQEGQVTKVRVTADKHGHFKTDPISLSVASLASTKNITYTLRCTATAKNKTSDVVTVSFVQ